MISKYNKKLKSLKIKIYKLDSKGDKINPIICKIDSKIYKLKLVYKPSSIICNRRLLICDQALARIYNNAIILFQVL